MRVFIVKWCFKLQKFKATSCNEGNNWQNTNCPLEYMPPPLDLPGPKSDLPSSTWFTKEECKILIPKNRSIYSY